VTLPLYQIVLTFLAAVLAPFIGGVWAYRQIIRQGQTTVEVKKLENAHAQDEWKHNDVNAERAERSKVESKYLEAEVRCATCEANLKVSNEKIEELHKEKQELEETNKRLMYENAEIKQKMAYVKFIDELGHLKPLEIIAFGQKMLEEPRENQ
jgi:septal ring factor EnvC (AmiA/AmiB activator)